MEQTVNSKVCTKCNVEKSFDEFHKDKYGKFGLKSHCKECVKQYRQTTKEQTSEYFKQYRQTNKEQIKQYYQSNKERILEQKKQYRQSNKEQISERQKQYRQANKERISERKKQWHQSNKEQILERVKQHYQKPEVKARVNERHKERYRTDPKFRLNELMSSGIRKSLKKRGSSKGGSSWLDYVDYTLEQLVEHLEKQFTPEMTWENQGSYWHIDHITAKASFNYTSPYDEEFKKCWALSNLQPLKGGDNMSKGAKTMEEWIEYKHKSSHLTPATI
jgi:hypothetical protein